MTIFHTYSPDLCRPGNELDILDILEHITLSHVGNEDSRVSTRRMFNHVRNGMKKMKNHLLEIEKAVNNKDSANG